jgi:hypothetical protein
MGKGLYNHTGFLSQDCPGHNAEEIQVEPRELTEEIHLRIQEGG